MNFALSMPPSTNRLHRTVRGRPIRSREHRAWLDAAAIMILAQARGVTLPAKTPFATDVFVDGLDRRSDLTNRIKVLEDVLHRTGVTPDDRWCDDFRVRRGEIKAPKAIRVTVSVLGKDHLLT